MLLVSVIVILAELLICSNAYPVQKQHKSQVKVKNVNYPGLKSAKPGIDKIIELAEYRNGTQSAESSHIALLKYALEHHKQNVHDYAGTFYKIERIGRNLTKKQVIDFKFRKEPFSLFMQWKKNPIATDRLLYVEKNKNSKMIVHPTGWLRWIKSVRRDPNGKYVYESNLYPPYAFGFMRMMKRALKIYERAEKNGDLKTKYLGKSFVEGRPCIAVEAKLPEKKNYPFASCTVRFDAKYLLPIEVKTFDWAGELRSHYLFDELCFNVGLTDEDFKPELNGL